jgi:hypothetical protein
MPTLEQVLSLQIAVIDNDLVLFGLYLIKVGRVRAEIRGSANLDEK